MAKSGKKSVEEMFADITAQLTTLMPLVDSVKKLTDKVTGLELMVAEAQKENGKLVEDLAERDRTIEDLKSQLSEATQYQRQWSIRVIGLQIPDSQKKTTSTSARSSTGASCSPSWRALSPPATSHLSPLLTSSSRGPTFCPHPPTSPPSL